MSLRYLKDRKRFEVSVTIGGERVRRYFKSKPDAQEFIRDVRLRQLGFDGIKREYKLSELFASYLELNSSQKIKQSVASDLRLLEIARHFFEKEHGLVLASQVGLEHLERFVIWAAPDRQCGQITKGAWSLTTIARNAHILKEVFQRAFKRELISKDPTLNWEIPSGDGERRRPMTVLEFEALCRVSPPWFLAVVRFQWLTGARGASVASLLWEDVHLETATLYLVSRKGGRGKSKRIPFPMYQALMSLIAAVPNTNDHVFVDENGDPVTPAKISRMGHRLIKRAGLKGVVLYGIRHALAVHLTEAGVPTEIVREAMGHSDIRMTQTYARGISLGTVGKAIHQIRDVQPTPLIATVSDRSKQKDE